MIENPFTPTFGEIPAYLAGRRQILEEFGAAFACKHRCPEFSTVFSGARGTGKTTMLSLIAEKAEELGWISASVTAFPGMLDEIELATRRNVAHLLEPQGTAHVSKVGIPQVLDIEFSQRSDSLSTWRFRMADTLDELAQHGTGLLITVDEVDPSLEEMVRLAAVYQHFVREGRRVALLMAGLPNNISALLNDKTVSFLRRAQMVHLGKIADFDIEEALDRTIKESGRTANVDGMQLAVKAIDGFPFMMQLVGYRAWNANPSNKEIAFEDFESGISRAREEMRVRIFDSTYRGLSPEDIRFLEAMLQDKGESSIAELTARLDRSSAQVAQYRRRLMDAGIIGSRGRGKVGFDLPFFREFMLEGLSDEL